MFIGMKETKKSEVNYYEWAIKLHYYDYEIVLKADRERGRERIKFDKNNLSESDMDIICAFS